MDATRRWEPAPRSGRNREPTLWFRPQYGQESANPCAFGCGKAKQDRRVTAGAMYVSTFHGSCRYAAQALLQDGGRQYILSAAHGLLDLSTQIDPYDITVGDPGSVSADFVHTTDPSEYPTSTRVSSEI